MPRTGTRIAIKVFRPKHIIDTLRLRAATHHGLEICMKSGLAAFEKTTKTWNHKVKFETVNTGTVAIVWTTNKRYTVLSEGTAPRVIVPRTKKMLRFYSDWRAKTRVRWLASFKGKVGKKPVFRKIIRHPGIKARMWEYRVASSQKRTFRSTMHKTLKAALVAR